MIGRISCRLMPILSSGIRRTFYWIFECYGVAYNSLPGIHPGGPLKALTQVFILPFRINFWESPRSKGKHKLLVSSAQNSHGCAFGLDSRYSADLEFS
jgi:hypothetical protein